MKDCYTVVPVADRDGNPNVTAKVSREVAAKYFTHMVLKLEDKCRHIGRNLTLEQAAEAVWGWCVGIDFTLGDQKLPSGATDFARAKSFERAAPVSHVRPAYRCPMPAPADLWLYVNNQKRQGGCTSNLIVQPLETIVELSRFWELQPGDMIFTGTCGGADKVFPGDHLEGGVNGVGSIKVDII